MKRVECGNDDCGAMFKVRSRNPADDIECPSCRMDDRDRSDPPETGCPIEGCDREPLSDRELRSLAGSSFAATVCVTGAGSVLVHRGDET